MQPRRYYTPMHAIHDPERLHKAAPGSKTGKYASESNDKSLLVSSSHNETTHAPRNRSDADTADDLPSQIEADVEQRNQHPDERKPAARF